MDWMKTRGRKLVGRKQVGRKMGLPKYLSATYDYDIKSNRLLCIKCTEIVKALQHTIPHFDEQS